MLKKRSDKFEAACRRFLAETDVNPDDLELDELLLMFYHLDHMLRGTLEDRRANLALLIQERLDGDE